MGVPGGLLRLGVLGNFVRRGGDRQPGIWDIPRGRQFPTKLLHRPPSFSRRFELNFGFKKFGNCNHKSSPFR